MTVATAPSRRAAATEATDVLGRGREFAFGQEPDDQQIDWNWSRQRQYVGIIGSRHGHRTKPRRAARRRSAHFAALCAHYPKHYIALIETKAAASSPESVLSGPAAAVEGPDASVRGEADVRSTRNL
jgi:hypothetical protein